MKSPCVVPAYLDLNADIRRGYKEIPDYELRLTPPAWKKDKDRQAGLFIIWLMICCAKQGH
jgi:hypothetical protein